MGPAEGSSKYNLRDLLLQNFRFNKENMTWMNLGKQLVNVLLGERSTITIENDIEEEVKLMREKGEPVSENVSFPLLNIRTNFLDYQSCFCQEKNY